MSSGSSGRYQSKLFNFVHQQSRRLTEQWENTFRHLQVATKWGVEALLYPVYLLFASGESVGKTLHTKESQPQLKLQSNDTDFQPETPPNADTPIVRVLAAVQTLSSNEAIPTHSTNSKPPVSNWRRGKNFLSRIWQKSQSLIPITHYTLSAQETQSFPVPTITDSTAGNLRLNLPVVRGIATNLVNRHLVLVSTDNEILDILTPQQQAKLEDRIISEIADYWHSWRLTEAQKESELLPEIHRLLAKLTGEDKGNIPALAEMTSKSLVNADKVLALLDTAVAQLEANAILPAQQRSQEIIRVVQTQLNILIYGKEQLVARGEIAVSADGLETQALDIPALIAAALNYFFGVSQNKKLESRFSTSNLLNRVLSYQNSQALPKSSKLQNEDLADPWLSWDDLFGNSETFANKPVTSSPKQKPALAPTLSVQLPQHTKLIVPKTGSSLVQKPKSTHHLTQSRKTSKKVTSTKQTEARISQSKSESSKGKLSPQQFRQSTEIEAKPDWIETTATSIGYEKHPLEQLLEWLDRAMLWLEKIVVKIFQSLQKLWRGK